MKKLSDSRFLMLAVALACTGACTSLVSAAPRKHAPKKAAPKKVVAKKAAPVRHVASVAPHYVSNNTVASLQEQARQRAINLVKQAADTFAAGDYRRTIQLCEAASDQYPTYARAHAWIGASYQKLGNTEEAIKAFRWARNLAPGTPDAERAERGLRELGYYKQ
jgi:tetratricopeptide (TPR) repeat protein